MSSVPGSPLLPLPWLIAFIFLAEACVVTLSTLRTIFLLVGRRPGVTGVDDRTLDQPAECGVDDQAWIGATVAPIQREDP